MAITAKIERPCQASGIRPEGGRLSKACIICHPNFQHFMRFYGHYVPAYRTQREMGPKPVMSRNTIRTAFGAVLLSILALPAAAGSGGSGIRKPVLLVDVPQLTQCRGLLTQALLDRVIAATEDPGAT